MEGPTIINLVIMAALVSAACASRDALPTARADPAARQQMQKQIVGPAYYNITPGQVGSLDFSFARSNIAFLSLK